MSLAVIDLSPFDALTEALAAYLSLEEIGKVEKAYHFAKNAHAGQLRKDGTPYINHPLEAATILTQWQLDSETIMAAILHDALEDTAVTKADLSRHFGTNVADLVDGVSKLENLPFQSKTDRQADSFRKMLLAMSRDVRVILIKLADRLHNMRTLETFEDRKKQRIARETLEIYAPLARRLGLSSMCHELEDLSFRYLYPNRYHVLAKAVRATRGTRREVVAQLKSLLVDKLQSAGIDAAVFGREKNLYSIYRKMQEKNIPFSEVLDIYGFRVIVKDTLACYMALGVLHGMFKPVPGRIKDYIALPKANGYQSLHSVLLGPNGMPIEIQLRTWEMHRLAEVGVASHWLYKTGVDLTDVQKKAKQWLHSLLQIQSETGDPLEFLENIKVDLFPDEIYVFSPKGEIIALPRGATPVDFAFTVHSEIGKHCVAAKINHELAPLRTELKTGDQVEIITSEHAKPNPAWLGFVVTGKARSQIRHFMRTIRFDESAALGEKLLQQALKSIGMASIDEELLHKYLNEHGAADKKSFFTDIGLGKRLPMVVAYQLTSNLPSASKKIAPVPISGTEGIAVQLATCCHPIPGDAIVGQIKKGKGLVVHTRDCVASSWKRWRGKSEEWLDCVWDAHKTKGLFNVKIRVSVSNRPGELAKIAALIAEGGSNITHVHMEELDGGEISILDFTLQVANRVHLANLIRNIRKHPQVGPITRMKG